MAGFDDVVDNGFLCNGTLEISSEGEKVRKDQQVVETTIGEFSDVVCDKWLPTRSGGSSPVCLRWVARSSEWENSDVVSGAGDRRFHEGYFPIIWRPRQGEPVCFDDRMYPRLAHRGCEHHSGVPGNVGQVRHPFFCLHLVAVVLLVLFAFQPLVAVLPLGDVLDQFHDPGVVERREA